MGPKRFFLIIASVFLLFCAGCQSSTEPPDEVSHLIHPDATNVLVKPLTGGGKWRVSYDIYAPFPPIAMLDFFRKNMRDANYFPDKMGEKGYWSWDEYLDTAATEEEYVKHYMAPWSTLSGNEVALVSLQYRKKAGGDWSDTLRCYAIFR